MPIAQLTYLASAKIQVPWPHQSLRATCRLPPKPAPARCGRCTFELWNEFVHDGPPLVRAFYHAYGREKAGDDYLGSVVHSRK